MNRLWVRFSIIICSLSLVMTLLWIGSDIVLDRIEGDNNQEEERITFDPNYRQNNLPEEIAEISMLIGAIGVVLGVLLSRGLSAPIVALSKAANQIGSGNLQQRVPVHNHSQELDDLARSFNRMATELENAETLRKNMLADISHELRTPLTVLSGQLHGALDNVVLLDEESLANLYGQTQHLIRLVEDLRLLALAEAHRLPLETSTVHLSDLWQELSANFSLIAEEKGITFSVENIGSLPAISADPGRLRQVFSNLLSNAIRHTQAGGEIIVSSALEEEQISLIIRDSGEGIAPDQLPHLFDRFYRSDTSRTRNTGGSGLGLAIVKALVETHQGKVTAESAGLNTGSTFTVKLPIVPTNQANHDY
ncbi:MAG: ATP-binding protein [Chloroflexota bacterium]